MTSPQTEVFVPLTTIESSPAGRVEFQATVLSQSGAAQKFQPASAMTAPSAKPPAPGAAACEPRVNVKRDGDRVTGIQIQCSCGEIIDLACVYEPAVPAPQATQPVEAPQPATMPQAAAEEPETGKICKESGKELPTSASKKPKVPEKGRGTSAAKRRSA
jgi:hypothetical protein